MSRPEWSRIPACPECGTELAPEAWVPHGGGMVRCDCGQWCWVEICEATSRGVRGPFKLYMVTREER